VAAVYFFENLPIELKIEALETAHPEQDYFYQNGPIHTFVQTIECNVLQIPPYQHIDAATIYRQLI
jgi:hypothetical protein